METWKSVPGYEQYEVSNEGHVRHVKNQIILKATLSDKRRQYVTLERKKITVHSLVAAAFKGPRPEGKHIDHLDGDFGNNFDTNLEYVSPKENARRYVEANGGLSVNLTKRVTTPGGKRYCPAVYSANSRIKQDWVIVNGVEEKHAEGAYYIEWTEAGRRRRQSVGTNAQVAVAKQVRKRTTLAAAAHGVTVVEEDATGPSLSDAASLFLDDTKLSHKPRSFSAYRTALEYFMESCGSIRVSEINRRHLLKFAAFLRDEKDQAPRSCWNKFSIVMGFLKAQKVTGIVKKGDWPKYVDEEPEIYEKEDIEKLLVVCRPMERLWWDFFLMTGMREQEVMHTAWTDVSFRQSMVYMSWKDKYGWTPKAYKERSIPVPQRLIDSLRDYRATTNAHLIFPTAGNRPKLDFLDCLKKCVKRTTFNPDDWYLHRFRATFATWNLWNGVDLRTVQEWMGHVDMESTLRYLKPSRSQETRDKVNSTFAL